MDPEKTFNSVIVRIHKTSNTYEHTKSFPTYQNENVGISNNQEQGFGPSDGHIETFGVREKAESALQVIALYRFIRANLHYRRIKLTLPRLLELQHHKTKKVHKLNQW